MSEDFPRIALQLRSLVRADQTVELSLSEIEVPAPGPGEDADVELGSQIISRAIALAALESPRRSY